MDCIDLVQGRTSGSCENGNRPSESTQSLKFLGYLSNYYLPKDSVAWNYVVITEDAQDDSCSD
jgi:hypothetical protein